MRTLSRAARRGLSALVLALAGAPALGQAPDPYLLSPYPERSSIQNQTGVSLPSPPMPYGQDEVRSASGVQCRSSVASSGPFLDAGLIGANDIYERDATAVYGRIVVPLGRRPRRVDCTRLYELEIERLRMELEIARMGMPYSAPDD